MTTDWHLAVVTKFPWIPTLWLRALLILRTTKYADMLRRKRNVHHPIIKLFQMPPEIEESMRVFPIPLKVAL